MGAAARWTPPAPPSAWSRLRAAFERDALARWRDPRFQRAMLLKSVVLGVVVGVTFRGTYPEMARHDVWRAIYDPLEAAAAAGSAPGGGGGGGGAADAPAAAALDLARLGNWSGGGGGGGGGAADAAGLRGFERALSLIHI